MAKSIRDWYLILKNEVSELSITDTLMKLASIFPEQVTFSTSFSYEDQVITDIIATSGLEISFFTLDTGRLFPETYSTWSRTLEKYPLKIKAYYPEPSLLEPFIEMNGPNAFYESVKNRKDCCFIRKVEPLKRALKNKAVWITGLRASHSADRQQTQILEWDELNEVIKFHPLLHWSAEKTTAYIKEKNLPYNILHDKGFVSIGCAPCTRAIKAGEDFRAGRWWWEDDSKKECGLHVHAETKPEEKIINKAF